MGTQPDANGAGTNGASPKPIRHDMLLIQDPPDGTKGSRLVRFPVDKGTGEPGAGAAVPPFTEGYRPVMNLGLAGRGTEENPARGTILSTLPLHPSPAASNGTTCYLVNAQNLNYKTAWTAEEWNDPPGGYDADGQVGPDSFSLLIGSPAGKVYFLEKKESDGSCLVPGRDYIFREVAPDELRYESEVWAELRSGCVVGTVSFENAAVYKKETDRRLSRPKIVPLVNIDSLMPRGDSAKKENA